MGFKTENSIFEFTVPAPFLVSLKHYHDPAFAPMSDLPLLCTVINTDITCLPFCCPYLSYIANQKVERYLYTTSTLPSFFILTRSPLFMASVSILSTHGIPARITPVATMVSVSLFTIAFGATPFFFNPYMT